VLPLNVVFVCMFLWISIFLKELDVFIKIVESKML